jgi:hypothetical protein
MSNLGTQFKDHELTMAMCSYTLSPYQYKVNNNNNGLQYKGVNFDEFLPRNTAVKKSVNDFSAQSYHRFLANDGYFNPNNDKSDLWYNNNTGGAQLNVQDTRHIILEEAQRGGLDTRNLAKYSPNYYCYNNRGDSDVDRVYTFDAEYCRQIGINRPFY